MLSDAGCGGAVMAAAAIACRCKREGEAPAEQCFSKEFGQLPFSERTEVNEDAQEGVEGVGGTHLARPRAGSTTSR